MLMNMKSKKGSSEALILVFRFVLSFWAECINYGAYSEQPVKM